MNLQNKKLASIRRQKKIYQKQIDESEEPQEQYTLSKKIMILEEEENKILKELGVTLASNY